MSTTTEQIKKLRAMTGAGMMDVKNALDETGGDIDRAASLLRERGIAKAAKKSDREAREGLVGSYVHHNGKVGVLVEVNCETDFVARNDAFKELARNLALHIAMAAPTYLRREDVPADAIEAERQALRAEALEEGKPESIVDKMVEGRIGKFFAENVLLEQPYIKDDKKTIENFVKETAATLGENVQIGSFSRIAIGE
jgi:elongation factor Ts